LAADAAVGRDDGGHRRGKGDGERARELLSPVGEEGFDWNGQEAEGKGRD
jgi:hypothetical protein